MSDQFELEVKPNGERSRVLWEGTHTKLVVAGVTLEYWATLEMGHLLLTTDDCPFEERLYITLLAPQLDRILDHVSLGVPYQTGILQDLVRTGDRQFEFSFFGAERWLLSVRSAPAWGIGKLIGPVRRPLRAAIGLRYLDLARL